MFTFLEGKVNTVPSCKCMFRVNYKKDSKICLGNIKHEKESLQLICLLSKGFSYPILIKRFVHLKPCVKCLSFSGVERCENSCYSIVSSRGFMLEIKQSQR